jgi:hypothetical protein
MVRKTDGGEGQGVSAFRSQEEPSGTGRFGPGYLQLRGRVSLVSDRTQDMT